MAHVRDQQRLASVARVTNDAIWDWDLLSNDMWWSDGYRHLFHEDPPPTINRWYEGVNSDDRDRVTQSIKAAIDLGQDQWRGEYRHRRADHSYRDLVDRGFIVRDERGRAVRVVGGITDVTASRQAQRELNQAYQQLQMLAEQYQVLIEQSVAGIYIIQDGRFVYANPRLAQMSGFNSAELLGRASIADILVEEDRAKVIEALWRRQAGEILSAPYAVRWKVPNGVVKWVEVFGTKIEYRGAPAVMGIAVDVTQRKDGEEQQQRLLAELIEARERLQLLSRYLMQVQEEERRQLARDLHDEIGQALTALKMTLRSVQRHSEPEPSAIDSSALDQGLEILTDIASKVRSLSLDLRPAMLDDLGLPETLHWFVTRQAERASLTAEVNVAENLKALDPERRLACFRIVQEAVTNIIKHANATRVEVKGFCEREMIRLTIGDDGIGFDTAVMLRRAARGECIGLLSMQERLNVVGGAVSFRSTPGEGTTVTATLPLMQRS